MGKENKNVRKLKKNFRIKELESLYGMLHGPSDIVFIKSFEEYDRLCDEFRERCENTGLLRLEYIYNNLLDMGEYIDYDGLFGMLRKFDELHGWNSGQMPTFKYRLLLSSENIPFLKDKEEYGMDPSLYEWLESSLRYVGKNLSDGSKIYCFVLDDDGSINCMVFLGHSHLLHILEIDNDDVQDLLYNECGVKKIELD